MKQRSVHIFSIFIGSIISLGIWILIGKMDFSWYADIDTSSGIRNASGYSFTNPLLECENNGSFAKQKYIPFEDEAIHRIQTEIQEKNPNIELSLYFRNLNNWPWFGINEESWFLPASLMKVTLLMSYLKWWDEDHTLLDKKTVIPTEGITITQLIPPKESLVAGNAYTIRELLYSLIVSSDNMAGRWLLAYIPESRQNQLFRDLSVPAPEWTNANYSLSVKEYASFFRILYNASYLSRKSSEAWLEILAQSEFRDWLVAWVPTDIRVSHKFGEREFRDETGITTNQLHDCGIVYHPNYPYLICIMSRTESADISSLTSIIRDSSRIVFNEIDSRYPYKK